ncbi:MAG: hypothetical protein PGN11_11120 [Quadrisphaera sp.]
MTVHVRDFPRPRHRGPLPTCPVRSLTAPSLGLGDDLGLFALQVRRAIQLGAPELLVDETACAGWTAGQLLVLEHLRRLAQRCGTRWTVASAERCSL